MTSGFSAGDIPSDVAEAALKAAPGAVAAVEFDEDDGRLVWEV
ncbi:PepSY domain-containing protein [Actinomadura hallensis]|nr:PepSY domain-containing protein [Actinomadura hallensis]